MCQSKDESRTMPSTFFTKESTTFLQIISSASFQRPRTSYVRRHSSTSAIDLVLSVSDASAVANTLSKSENNVDFMRSIRYMLARQRLSSSNHHATIPIVSRLQMRIFPDSPSRCDRGVECTPKRPVRDVLRDFRERAHRVDLLVSVQFQQLRDGYQRKRWNQETRSVAKIPNGIRILIS